MRVTLRDDIERAEHAARLSASNDEIAYRRLLRGDRLPAGVDVSSLLRRVEQWERARLIDICAETGCFWWHALLCFSIKDAHRRRKRERIAAGDVIGAHLESVLKWTAYAGVAWMYLRYLAIPRGLHLRLSPLRWVLAYTA
jgi:hypothetical protein